MTRTLRPLLLVPLLSLAATAVRAQSSPWTPEQMRERIGRLAAFWAERYDVPDSVYRPVLDGLPLHLPWAICSVTESGFRLTCTEAYTTPTPAHCTAAAIAVLANRAITLGEGRLRPGLLVTELSCAAQRFEMSVAASGASELRRTDPATHETLDQRSAAAPTDIPIVDPGPPGERPDRPRGIPRDRSADTVSGLFTEPPSVLNRPEIGRRLRDAYPAHLRNAGVGGTAVVWMFVDENGRVLTTLLEQSSRFSDFDDAALSVARKMTFQPAKLNGAPIAVWIALPIVFMAR